MTKLRCIQNLAVAGLLASVAVPASAADTITVASWGGTYQEAVSYTHLTLPTIYSV